MKLSSVEEPRLISLTDNLLGRDLNFKEEIGFLAQLNEKRTKEGIGGESDLSRVLATSVIRARMTEVANTGSMTATRVTVCLVGGLSRTSGRSVEWGVKF